MTKADNMLAILWMLKQGRKITATEIAERLEIHVRTVYRHIDALCASGVPVISEAGHHGGFSLLQPLAEDPLFFDADEQRALVHAAALARESGYPFGDKLEQAIRKLKRFTRPAMLEKLQEYERGMEVLRSVNGFSGEEIMEKLEEASAERITLRIHYCKNGEQPDSSRCVDPYGIVYWQEKWYMVAFCHTRSGIRSFRVDRIQSAEATGEYFERPDSFSTKAFFLNGLKDTAVENPNPVTLRIQAESWALEELCNHWYMQTLLIRKLTQEAVFEVEHEALHTFVAKLLLSYGQSLRIHEPAGLNEHLAVMASELADYFRQGSSS